MAGACIGVVSVAATLYVSELAEPRVRGALGTLFQLQMTIGILYEYLAGGKSFTSNLSHSKQQSFISVKIKELNFFDMKRKMLDLS